MTGPSLRQVWADFGPAMLRVLQAAFVAAFRGRLTLGALVSLLVTVADITMGNIGAAFRDLVAGLGVAWPLERPDFIQDKPA